MKYLILLLFISTTLFTSCMPKSSDYYTVKARITYYYNGQDKWGSQVADPRTKRAKQGVTVAAHPKFKFGQKIEIPQLAKQFGDSGFIVQDRGSAVTKKTAAKGRGYVFDVYCKDRGTYRRMIKNSEWMTVRIYRN